MKQSGEGESAFETDSGESTRDKWVSLCVSVCNISAAWRFWRYAEGPMSGLRDTAFKWTQECSVEKYR